ncbi:winged helix DNA-binding domain-containing protein [Cellulomonas sp. P22]|uniref:winged helix DNA-binding domain-containing protein n=1 Tax=Cellulomonas sp. P22 TaxID=3373189 RepID=UPI0037BBDC97
MGRPRHTDGATLTIGTTELLRLRLSAQGLGPSDPAPPPGPASDVAAGAVGRLFALQGQDLPGVLWSIGRRSPGADVADVRGAFTSGDLVRSWPFRGTLHVLAARDLPWVLALTRDRMLASAARRERELNLDATTFTLARDAAVRALEGGRSLARSELLAAFEDAGVRTDQQRGYHLLWHLGLEGVVVLGPFHGAEQHLVLLDEWVSDPRDLRGADAVREVVLRHLAGRGAASVADVAWWSKLPVRAVRAAVDELQGSLTGLDHEGTTLWAVTEALDTPPAQHAPVLALPGFDELLLGYTDRTASLADEHALLTVPGGNGMFKPTVVVDGHVAGLWSRKVGARRATLTFTPLEVPFDDGVRAGIRSEADRYGRFLGVEADVVVEDEPVLPTSPVRSRQARRA